MEIDTLLTPDNERVFLYDSSDIDFVELYRAAYRKAVSTGDPAARSYFDVYLGDDTLTFVREPCVWEDLVPKPKERPREIFVEVTPEDPKDLPRRHERYRSDNPILRVLPPYPVLIEGKCIAVLRLPGYPVSHIRTGQYRIPPPPHWVWVVDIDIDHD